MHIVTTHKGTDFDALASVVAVNLLYPGFVTVLPGSLNPNVRAFLSLHKDLFACCINRKTHELEIAASYGLSDEYINKGPLSALKSTTPSPYWR